MRIRTIAACCLTLFLILRIASTRIEELSGRSSTVPRQPPDNVSTQMEELSGPSRADPRRPPEQDPGWNLGHTRPIYHLDFSPDRKLIMSCAEDHTLRLWSAGTGALVRTIHQVHPEPLFARFTPDGQAILASFRDNTLGLWSVREGKPLTVVHTADIVFNPLWTPNGSRLVTTEAKGDIVVRSRNLHLLRTFHTHAGELDLCALTKDGRAVIYIARQNPQAGATPVALDLQTGRKVHGWFESREIEALTLSPNGKFAVTEEPGYRQVVRRASTGEVLFGGLSTRDRVLFSRDGRTALVLRFVEQYSTHTGQLLSIATWKPVEPRFDAEYVGASALSPDGSVAVLADEQQRNRFRLFSTATGKVRWASADPFLILGSKPSLALLKQLSQDYAQYGLPSPPESAKLAYFVRRVPPRTHQGPPDRILGLVELAANGQEKARWCVGFGQGVVGNEIVVPVELQQARVQGTQKSYAIPRFVDDSDLPMAVFCYRRGWTALGLDFLKRKLEGYRGDIREDFAASAWSYWEDSLVQPRYWEGSLFEPATDHKTAAKYLHLLFDRFKALQKDHNRSLLADLDATVQSSAVPHTGIEGEIDKLTEVEIGSYGWPEDRMDNLDKANPVLRSLWLRGFEAVPFLIRHLDDRRMVHGAMTGMNMYRSHIMRVGELVSKLLYALAGEGNIERGFSGGLELASRTSAGQWWARAQAVGEDQYLLDHILPAPGPIRLSRDSSQDRPNAHNAAILAYKYPDKLPGVYESLLDRFPQAQVWALADLLAGSKAPQAEKERLLVRTATSGDRDRQIAGFWALIKMHYPGVLDLLVKRMDTLPPRPEGAYWLGEAGALGSMVQELDSPRGWDALERLARRSVVGQRLEILQDLNNLGAKESSKRHRIEFLARFLDDNTLCDFSQDLAGFQGPHADFDLKAVTVRNAALRSIAYLVGVRDYPDAAWKPEDWDAWRPKVQAALRQYLAETPGGK